MATPFGAAIFLTFTDFPFGYYRLGWDPGERRMLRN